jgi:hypothetical protein
MFTIFPHRSLLFYSLLGTLLVLICATSVSADEYQPGTAQVIYQSEKVFDEEGNLLETRVTGKPFLEMDGQRYFVDDENPSGPNGKNYIFENFPQIMVVDIRMACSAHLKNSQLS